MNTQIDINALFGRRLEYPDCAARDRLARLVGLDEHKARLAKMLGLLVNPARLTKWGKKHHPDADAVLAMLSRRPPLVILAGDVGSGKTELAESIGDAVAREERIDVALHPLSLAARGQGRVGEMTQLLTAAFDHTLEAAARLKGKSGAARGAILLLVDEADALAQSRETAQMHHEDRAGVNAFIRGVDRIANEQLPAAVIMCTNRLRAIDPAVRRRAADILLFDRPDEPQRRAVLQGPLRSLGFSESEVEAAVAATGSAGPHGVGFTFSDLTQRLLPAIVLDAYPDKAIDPSRALAVLARLVPTPRFQEERQ